MLCLTCWPKIPTKHKLRVIFSHRVSFWGSECICLPDREYSLSPLKGDTGDQFPVPAFWTASLIDILEIFNNREIVNPCMGNCPSIEAFSSRGNEREKEWERGKEHNNFCTQATVLVSICSPAAVVEVPGEEKTALGTPTTMAYF